MKKSLFSLLLSFTVCSILSCKSDELTPDLAPTRELEPFEVSTFVANKDKDNNYYNYRAYSIAFDKANNLYFADGISKIYKVTTNGQISVYAGSTYGFQDGSSSNAQFLAPLGVAFDSFDNLYVADTGNRVIRKVSKEGQVTTFAGQPYDYDKTANVCIDGIGNQARFASPINIVIDKSNNIYVAEWTPLHTPGGTIGVIRKITTDAKVTTFSGIQNRIPESFQDKEKDSIILPYTIALNKAGELFVGEPRTSLIHKINSSGKAEIYAGTQYQPGRVDGPALTSKLSVFSMAFDPYDNLYVGATGVLRKVSANGVVSTVCGYNDNYVDGPIAKAGFDWIYSLAFDRSGNLFAGEINNFTIRKITFK